MPLGPLADLLRPELRGIEPYAPHPGAFRVRLDANEAPPLLPEAARARLLEVAASTAFERYPPAGVEALRAALAERSGVDADEVLVGVGSDEIITLLLTALCRPRRGESAPVLLGVTPTFVMYAMSARVRGHELVEVPLDEHWDLPLAELGEALERSQPGLLFLASPNNPTSNMVSEERLIALIERAPSTLFVIDEAYIDYADHTQFELFRRYPNVALLRTLSKIGFAALRVGWLVADRDLVRELDKVRLPYNIPTLSQRLATFAVAELADEMRHNARSVVAERARVAAELAALPWLEVAPSQANFLWVRTSRPASDVFAALAAAGILVRSFHRKGGRLAHQLRITIGTQAENDALLQALRAL